MELLFNELSTLPFAATRHNAIERMELFAKAANKAKEHGFTVIRSHYSTNDIIVGGGYSLWNWFNDELVSKDLKDYLYGVITSPFISESDGEIEDGYLAAEYGFVDDENGIDFQECLGLAAAHLYQLPAISFQSSDAWKKNKLSVIIDYDFSDPKDVFNIYEETSLEDAEIQVLIEERSKLVLTETDVLPANKNAHFAPHHGQKELDAMWTRLKKSPYVTSAQSTDWGGKRFIRKCFADGIVEIVLYTTQREYAMRVQTTGRNKRETEAIAKILEEKYS